jgi:hypothetical protein
MTWGLTLEERKEKEEELVKLRMMLKDTEEEAKRGIESLSDSELIGEITDCGMCIDWE